jgi:hypothetical protein
LRDAVKKTDAPGRVMLAPELSFSGWARAQDLIPHISRIHEAAVRLCSVSFATIKNVCEWKGCCVSTLQAEHSQADAASGIARRVNEQYVFLS